MNAARNVEPVEVWFVDAGEGARIAAWEGTLGREERVRAARLRAAGDRAVYIAAHGAARELLGRRLDVEPASLRFVTEPGGRPRLENASISFSLSRTNGAALVAVSSAGPVGVDIERVSPGRNDDLVADRFFSPAERIALEARPPGERTAVFFRIWTRKEALLKAIGSGIHAGIERIDVTGDSIDAQPASAGAPRARWTLRTLDLPAPYAGAVAAAGVGRTVFLRRP